MTSSNDDHAEPALRPDIVQELDGLVARLCDNVMTEEDGRRLNQILEENGTARRYYLRNIAVHSALITTAGSHAWSSMSLEGFAGQACSKSTPDRSLSLADHSRSSSRMIRWVASLAAVLLVLGSVLWWADHVGRHDDQLDHVADERDPTNLDVTSTAQRIVAEVTYVSESARWRNPNGSYALASSVRSGQDLALERGQVELTYASGAKLLLTGPSAFLVQPTGGKLRRGELVARVPEAGHGFTIETPHGKVVDLGTEFGVVVDDFGVSQVSVFEGKVETLPIGIGSAAQNKFELTSGRAILWTNDAIIPINVRGRRYHRSGDDVRSDESMSLTAATVDDHFRGESLSPDHWKTIGEVLPTPRGLRMGSQLGTAQKPFLITAREFDPSQGAVTVTCELRFADVRGAENASFAILTRSADEQSKQGTPWQDMLARCVRCCLAADARSGEGILAAGTKFEADRELTNLSWSGFSRPQPDTRYRLEMRDDGLNVSFTVSLAENPSVRKTITCRSLFRGKRNYIALEGFGTGATIIERLQITQDGSPSGDSRQLASNASESSGESRADAVSSTQQLDELAPRAAVLLMTDDFDDGELNSRIWATLGDVVLQDGQVQLGLPNPDQQIDTWKARPYLLTKQQFEPANGTLTILGMVTFAENFLHGYGGSFAVMTRAGSSHGGGPGWENSILRWGVRSNFWPAAFGFDHSLEIHEKPATSTISLLTAKGLQINPTARSYLFRVVDDGKSATLTLIDASDPDVRETISHPTTSPSLSRGHIGFESCWGSPVLLDKIRIYESKDKSPNQASNGE